MRDLKIIARLFGSIINKLFIYVDARRLALINNSELMLDNVRGFTRDADSQRHYQRVHLYIQSMKLSQKKGLYLFDPFRLKILINWYQYKNFAGSTYFLKVSIDFHPQLLAFKPRGYWQNEQFFNDEAATIRYLLQIKPHFDAASHLQQINFISKCQVFHKPHKAGSNITLNNGCTDTGAYA